MLSKPSPFFAVFYKPNCGAVNSMLLRYFALRSAVDKDAQHLRLGKDRLPVTFPFAFEATLTTFFFGISHVVQMSAKPKMFWIYARRVVASVTNIHSFWDSAFVRGVKEAVGRVMAGPFIKIAVTICGFRPVPNPAAGLLVNFISRSGVNSFYHPTVVATCGSHLNRGKNENL